MKILFSPSEDKTYNPIHNPLSNKSFTFQDFEIKKDILDAYNKIVLGDDEAKISKLTGIKDPKKFEIFKTDTYKQKTQKAITLYSGVAFKYLEYEDLKNKVQKYIDENVIIFSNLFGAIRASDLIPNYKLKQGEEIYSEKIDAYYKKHQSPILDDFLENELILDLRAGVYEKFYTIKTPYISMKFINKDGKSISHWAKAYRGMVLKDIAICHIKTKDELVNHSFENLKLKNIKTIKNKEELTYVISQ